MNTLKIVDAKYPKLFTERYLTHCLEFLNEYTFKVPELCVILKKCVKITKYIHAHKYMKVVFTCVVKTDGRMLLLCPDTRFTYTDKKIGRVSENKNNLTDMIYETGDTGDVPS